MIGIFPSSLKAPHCAALVSLLSFSVITYAETWVITDQTSQVSASADVRRIYLDEQKRLEEQLSHHLPADLSQAPATIQRYLSSPAGKRLQSELAHAQQGLTDAWSLGIEKIPAIVVDRRYVIYGETDVAKAVERINQARGSSK